MITKLKRAFPKIYTNGCYEVVNHKEFDIYDCKEDNESSTTGRCYIQQDGDFKVINLNQKKIGFLAVDKCVFFDEDTIKKCDCIIMDDETLCFIEIKDCKSRNRSNRKREAKKQLKSTIEFFESKVEVNRTKEAYLCVGVSRTRPSKLASSMDSRIEFEENLDTRLFDGCQKEFK
jgi:hypothetical protein